MADRRTAYVILGMLSIEPNRSGYDIRKAIEGSVGYFWHESYGQIYPTLKRLVAEGLIAPARKPASSRQRQEYALTKAGRMALRRWLAEPFENDPPRNEFLLKLFFAREAAPGVARAHIDELQKRNRESLETMKQLRTISEQYTRENPHWPYWMLTLGLGEAMTEAAVKWADTALIAVKALERWPSSKLKES